MTWLAMYEPKPFWWALREGFFFLFFIHNV
jgi:hypothetical protein